MYLIFIIFNLESIITGKIELTINQAEIESVCKTDESIKYYFINFSTLN